MTYKGQLQAQIQYSVNGEPGPPIVRQIGQIPVMVKVKPKFFFYLTVSETCVSVCDCFLFQDRLMSL